MSRFRHSYRPARKRAVVVGLLAALVSALIPAAAAQAALGQPGKKITMKNADVSGHCSLTTLSVDYDNGTERVKIGLQAQPTFLSGYSRNASTAVVCWVQVNNPDPNGLPIIPVTFFIHRDAPTVPATSEVVTIPFDFPLTLCGYAVTVLKSGSYSDTGNFCG